MISSHEWIYQGPVGPLSWSDWVEYNWLWLLAQFQFLPGSPHVPTWGLIALVAMGALAAAVFTAARKH